MYTVKLSSKGQIVIPKEVRERLRLERDPDLILQEAGEALVLGRKKDVERILHDQFVPLSRASERRLAELWEQSGG